MAIIEDIPQDFDLDLLHPSGLENPKQDNKPQNRRKKRQAKKKAKAAKAAPQPKKKKANLKAQKAALLAALGPFDPTIKLGYPTFRTNNDTHLLHDGSKEGGCWIISYDFVVFFDILNHQ